MDYLRQEHAKKVTVKRQPNSIDYRETQINSQNLMLLGSTVTLIDEQVANRIGAKRRRETLHVSSVGGNETTDEGSRVIRVKIKGLFSPNMRYMTAWTMRNLKLVPHRAERATAAACFHLKDIAETYRLLDPTGLSSTWMLHQFITADKYYLHYLRPFDYSDDELNGIVKRNFDIESHGMAPRKANHDPKEKALSLFDSTSINNLFKNGYADPVPNKSTPESLWYLPHFAVTYSQKKKVRLIFDAAAHTNGRCLKDAMFSLLGVPVRFRQGCVAVSADIKKIFLRVKVRKKDRDSLHSL
ncbi:hypothetical protein EVAR_27603_1 [Eumeta japonica]|uniref:Uncharacterized protein n=1 Tax=Eumeta variegata TaxID=151549 RepID=A0A4C1V0Z1_EUMVA|nr:hypothetical protein EVAR_27603_1 [Eumeta japonica]